ncbi:MAG: HAMP domain-containing histidine kinase [Clostridiaceae bacterium]|nr:HAMP domain-containing histidine kinase [Clostridiaceae bacterium]
MIKIYSIRAKLSVIILSVIIPILIARIIYLHKGFQNIETIQGNLYNVFLLELYRYSLSIDTVFICIYLLLLMVVVFLFEKNVTKPLSILKSTSQKFLSGDYSARANINNKDEIGIVAESLNHMAENIENLNKNRQAFYTHLLHEFKTPLNVIFSSIQLIDAYYKNADCETYRKKASKQMKIILQNCLRIMRITNNLIDINRHGSGYLSIKPDNYDIVKLIKDITNSVKRYTESKGIRLLFESTVGSRVIACDPDMIERIMLNLISNAIKFTDKGGTITVRISENEKDMIISVTDTGIGIPEKKLSKIFELFNKDEEDVIHNKEGTGIGLYLVKAFVEAHNGKIKATSEVSKGTTFDITLPKRVIEKAESQSVNKSYTQSVKSSISDNLVNRINIEFSDIYSCYNDDEDDDETM